MNRDYFWFADEQFARMEPHLMTDTRGKLTIIDQRVIGGIIRVSKGSRIACFPANISADRDA